jgi:hypothetical protein
MQRYQEEMTQVVEANASRADSKVGALSPSLCPLLYRITFVIAKGGAHCPITVPRRPTSTPACSSIASTSPRSVPPRVARWRRRWHSRGRVCHYVPISTGRAQRYIRSQLLLSTFR